MVHHRTHRRSHRRGRSRVKSKARSKARSKAKSKSNTVHSSNKYTNIKECIKLFRKYKLTDQKKMVKWVNHNHEDKAKARGEKQPAKLIDDYKVITGCFANRKKVFSLMKSSKPMKSKSKSKKKNVKGITF
jgi:hypothetical protein